MKVSIENFLTNINIWSTTVKRAYQIWNYRKNVNFCYYFSWHSVLEFPLLCRKVLKRSRDTTPMHSLKFTSNILIFNDHEGIIHNSSCGLCKFSFFYLSLSFSVHLWEENLNFKQSYFLCVSIFEVILSFTLLILNFEVFLWFCLFFTRYKRVKVNCV